MGFRPPNLPILITKQIPRSQENHDYRHPAGWRRLDVSRHQYEPVHACPAPLSCKDAPLFRIHQDRLFNACTPESTMSQAAPKLDFTADQKKAINHTKGFLRIIACPGSGKTEVVSQRIANLIKDGANPRTIVAFTFTDKAAGELKTRIRRILDRERPDRADFGDMFVGTIHSFCSHMLKELDPAYRAYDMLDEAKRMAFVSKKDSYYRVINLQQLQKAQGIKWRQTIERFLASLDIVMTEDIDLKKIPNKEFQSCARNYLDAIDRENYFDFSTVTHTLVTVLKQDEKKLNLLGQKIKHVVLDEYQDVNNIQEQLLGLLSKNADSVAVVGDDDQTIYNWRGSNAGIIRGFKERYGKDREITDVSLDVNFRSTDGIVHTARKFIEHNGNRIEKSMVSNKNLKRRYEPGDIVCRHFDDEKDELGFIADTIRNIVGTDFVGKQNRPFALSFGDLAVLVRKNADAARIIDYLTRNGIACIASTGESIFASPEVSLVMDCIRYVFGYRDFRTGQVPHIDSLKSRYAGIFEGAPEDGPARFASRLSAVRLQADDIGKRSPKDRLGGRGLQEFYYKILNAMGAEDFDFEDAVHHNLAVLSQAISDYESVWVGMRVRDVEGFFYFVYIYARKRYLESHNSGETVADAVRVMTIHKAKGLEFAAVFVASLRQDDPYTPPLFVDSSLYDSAMYKGTVEDERRLYYTAFTRSKKYLFVTGSRRIPGDDHGYGAHPFMAEMPGEYLSDKPAADRPRSGLKIRPESLQAYSASFSQLSSYNRCPYDFKLRHIYGYNPGVPAAFGYGTNIHNALNVIHSDYIRNQKIPDDAGIAEMFGRIFKLRYADSRMAQNMKKAGLEVVKNYVRLFRHDFGRILETEKNFEFVIDDALVSGDIDLLKKVDDAGDIAAVEIIDFKSERKDGTYRADHQRQLRYYAIACLESLGLRPEKAYVHHLDDGEKDYVDISDRHLEETKSEIGRQITGILDGEFGAAPEEKRCSDCDYKSICPYKKFEAGVGGRAESA